MERTFGTSSIASCMLQNQNWGTSVFTVMFLMSAAIGDTMKNFAFGDPLMGRVYIFALQNINP